MRAAAWSTNRDLGAARLSWERARRIADALPDDDPDQLSMRIAPRTMLCATDWQARAVQESRGRFAELRELCSAAGDKVSLAIGMTGLATELLYAGRSREGSRLASEQMALLESIGDPTLTMGLAFVAFANWFDAGEFGEILRWSQTVIDLAAGDPAKGAGFGMGSPLAIALAFRGVARWWLGRPGWRQDLHDAVAMARNSDPATLAGVVAWTYGLAIQYGVLRADDSAVRAIEEAVQTAEGSSNDIALSLAEYTLGVALLNRDAAADRHRGLELMVQARDIWLRERAPFLVPVTELWAARERARRGDRDAAIAVMRKAVDELHQAGRLGYGVWGTGVLVETLLERGAEGDLAEAQEAIDRLANLPADRRFGDARDHAAAAARAAGPRPRRRCRLPGLGESLSRDGGIAWLRRTHRLGRGDDRMTADATCGSCGTELRENAKFCRRVRHPDDGCVRDTGVQAGDGAVRRCGAVDGHCSGGGCGAVARDHDRAGQRAAAVVQRYGGTVEKFTGDGVMALFGAPVALEDHAIRACLAALDIQDEAARLAAEVAASRRRRPAAAGRPEFGPGHRR